MVRSYILILFVLASVGYAENIAPGIERISVSEGLPSKYPYRLALIQRTVWVTMRAAQGAFRINGIVRVDGTSISEFSGTNTGLRSDAVNALTALDDGTLYAASEKGLHRYASNRFEAVGAAVPLTHITADDTGTVWSFGSDDEKCYSMLLRGGRTTALSMKKRYRPLALFAATSNSAWLVHQGGILVITEKAMTDMPLTGTPLWKKENRDPDGPVPSVWIYSAVKMGPAFYFVGHTKALVRYENGFHVVTNGHFGRLAAGGGNVFASDFNGSIYRYDGASFSRIFSGARSIGHLYASAGGTLWAEVDMERNAPHALIRYDAPYTRETKRYSLLSGSALSPGICDMAVDENGLWLATNDGLWKIQ